MRETWEEAGATVDVISPFAQLDIPLIGQVNCKTCLMLSFSSLFVSLLLIMPACCLDTDICYILGKPEESGFCTWS